VAVLLGTPDMSRLVGADDPTSYSLEARGGTVVNNVISVGIAIAIINAVLTILLQLGRLLFASARDQSWPDWINRPFATVHPRLRTPVTATLTVGIAGALLLWLVSFDVLLTVTGASLLITYALVALAAFVGRRRGRTSRTAYRMPAWPAIPLLMLVATVVVGYEVWTADWVPVIVALAIFAAGLPYYYLFLHPRRGDRWTLPDAAAEEPA
jgi:amino acid transporter